MTSRIWVGAFVALCAAAVYASAVMVSRAEPSTSTDSGEAANGGMTAPSEGSNRGAIVYANVCAACHDRGVGHAPPGFMLRIMTPETIYRVLTAGPMRVQAQDVPDSDKKAVAEYLAGTKLGENVKRTPPKCAGEAAVFQFGEPPAFPTWGISYSNTRYIPKVVSGITSENVSQLKLKWAFGVPGVTRMRSLPGFAGGAIYVGTDDGTVYALDARSGCERWEFQAAAEVRTGIVISPWNAGDRQARPLAYFGDLVGNVYAVDAVTGALAWSDHVDEHPSATITGSPVLYKDRLYVPVSSLEEGMTDPRYECCTFRGSIIAYDARSGKRLWQTFMMGPPALQGTNVHGINQYGPSGAAIWNTPAIDEERRLLYFGTGDNYSSPANAISNSLVAVDTNVGGITWSYQTVPNDAWNEECLTLDPANCPKEKGPDVDIAASVILATMKSGKQLIVVGQKSGWVYAIDPHTHNLVWKTRVGRGGLLGGIYFGMATAGNTLFVPISDAPDGAAHDEPARPGLYALDLRDGSYLWKAPNTETSCAGRRRGCDPGLAAAITVAGDLVLTGGSDGWLRFYDTTTGQILWRYDTTQSVLTTSGREAAGGSMGGGTSPLAYHGMLIAVSGYGFFGHMPGNIMLVFGVN